MGVPWWLSRLRIQPCHFVNAVAWIQSLAWELLDAVGGQKKKKKKKKKKREKEKKKKERKNLVFIVVILLDPTIMPSIPAYRNIQCSYFAFI